MLTKISASTAITAERVFYFLVATSAISLLPLSGLADATPSPVPSQNLFSQSSTTKVLGHDLGGSFQSGLAPNVSSTPSATATSNAATTSSSSESFQQVMTTVTLDILGAGLQALQALSKPPNTINGTTYTEFYSFGKRVFSQDSFFSSSGVNQFDVGLTPAEIRVPLVIYPVGPVALEVDGGARFQADLQGSTSIVIGIPLTLTQLGVQLQAQADAAGFIEGYANFLVVRAGVGGQVNLVDANATVNAEFSFNGIAPYANVSAMVDFLSGSFYAFLDYFSLAHFGWYRLLDYNLYSWSGYCFATEASLCP